MTGIDERQPIDIVVTRIILIVEEEKLADDLISLNEAASLIGKNLRTIQRYLKSGRLTHHEQGDKNFISKKELEAKFNVTTEKPKETATQTTSPRPQKTFVAQGDSYWQKKWGEEIEKHAHTREELGQWKGRAEAYQAFATRLLGNGEANLNVENLNQSPEIKKDESVSSVNRPPQNYSFIYYLAFAVLFVILILLFVLIRIYTA